MAYDGTHSCIFYANQACYLIQSINVTGLQYIDFKVYFTQSSSYYLQVMFSGHVLADIYPVYTGSWTDINVSLAGYSGVGNFEVQEAFQAAMYLDAFTTVNMPSPAAPVASFTSNMQQGLNPLTVQFTDLSTGSPTGWLWDFGDGNTSNVQSPQHTYYVQGNYTVSLTASNAGGNSTMTRASYISVYNYSYTVQGYAYDYNGTAIQNVNMVLQWPNGTTINSVYTDATGHYAIAIPSMYSAPPYGTYSLTASKTNYSAVTYGPVYPDGFTTSGYSVYNTTNVVLVRTDVATATPGPSPSPGVIGPLPNSWNPIDYFSWIANAIAVLFGGFTGWLGSIWSGIGGLFSLLGAVYTFITGGLGSLLGLVVGAINGLLVPLNSIYSFLTNTLFELLNALFGLLNNLVNLLLSLPSLLASMLSIVTRLITDPLGIAINYVVTDIELPVNTATDLLNSVVGVFVGFSACVLVIQGALGSSPGAFILGAGVGLILAVRSANVFIPLVLWAINTIVDIF